MKIKYHFFSMFVFISTILFAQNFQRNNILSEKNTNQNTLQKNIKMFGRNREYSYDSIRFHSPEEELLFQNKQNKLLKSKSIQWNWDTIITYDTTGLRYQRLTQTFDINGNVLIKFTEQWQANTWQNNNRETYTYDATGNQLTDLYENWQSNTWKNYSRYTYTYDINGNKITYLYEYWQTNAWLIMSKNTYTYDINGNMLIDLREDWQNNTWINGSRYTYTYDINENILTYLYELWQSSTWVNTTRKTNTYDIAGNMLTEFFEHWQNNIWVNSGIGTYTYDANGNMMTALWESWQNNAWVNWAKNTYTYDIYGNRITDLYEHWQINVWVNSSNITYSSDANGNSITGKFEDWQAGNWSPNIGGMDIFCNQSFLFNITGYRYEASYISFQSGIEKVQSSNSDISVFPNPASTYKITIFNKTNFANEPIISIFNISGCLIMYNKSQNENSIELDVNTLSKGIYLLQIQDGNKIENRKLIIN